MMNDIEIDCTIHSYEELDRLIAEIKKLEEKQGITSPISLHIRLFD